MSDWININMESGVPPEIDNYESIIENLDPNSVYEYRAYAVVDGGPVYGDIRIGITKRPTPKVPTVTTGNVTNITTTSMKMAKNVLTDKGSSDIIEFGVLYTQIPLGQNIQLAYDNQYIEKRSLLSSIEVDALFLMGGYSIINGLESGRTTYYRAFAKNSEGIGYGEIKSAKTNS